MICFVYIISGNIFEAITDFTKSKISDLIIERDNYKNRLEEVQEAFRWTEMLRATKYDQLNRGSLHLRMLRRKSLIKYLALGRNGLKKKSSVEAFFKPLFGTSSSNTLVKPSAEPKTEPAETIKRYRCVVGKVRTLGLKHTVHMIWAILYGSYYWNFEFYEPSKGYCKGIPKNKEERTENTYKSLCTMCTLSIGARAIRATHKEYQSTHQTPKSLHWHRNQARNKSMTPGSNRVGHSRTPRTPNRSPFATRTPNLTPHSTPQKPPRKDFETNITSKKRNNFKILEKTKSTSITKSKSEYFNASISNYSSKSIILLNSINKEHRLYLSAFDVLFVQISIQVHYFDFNVIIGYADFGLFSNVKCSLQCKLYTTLFIDMTFGV